MKNFVTWQRKNADWRERESKERHVPGCCHVLFIYSIYYCKGDVREAQQEKDMMSLAEGLWRARGLAACRAVVILAVVCVSVSASPVCFGRSSRQRLQ